MLNSNLIVLGYWERRAPARHSSLYTDLKARHSGMDCRNLGYMDVYRLPSMALDTGFPAGMTVYLTFVYNDESSAQGSVIGAAD
jgi:hypothetical protein